MAPEKFSPGYILLPYLAFLILHVLMALQMEVPIVVPDEFTYLVKAGHISGFAETTIPKGITQPTGLGYSLLIAPAFLLFDNPVSIYVAALVINSIIAASLYIWIFVFLKQLFRAADKQAFIISILVSLYPAYLLQSNMAWTDAVTPALFSALLVSFYNIFRRPGYTSVALFAIAVSFLFSIHIRFIPIPFIGIVFLWLLAKKGIVPKNEKSLAVSIIVLLFIISMVFGEKLKLAISGINKSDVILVEFLFRRIDLILAVVVIAGMVYFRLSLSVFFISSLASALAGLLFGIPGVLNLTAILVIVLLVGFYAYIKIKKKLNYQKLLYLLSFNALTFLVLFYIQGIWSFADFTEFFYYLYLGASGKLFYIFTSTLGLFFISIISLLSILWKETKFDPDKVFANPDNLKISFLLTCGAALFLIITNDIVEGISEVRPDRLFYGRYIEAFSAPFIAAGIYFVGGTTRKLKPAAIISSALVLIAIAALIILNYGNHIVSEPSFRNFLSYFVPRTVFGGINVMIFAGGALAGMLLLYFLAKMKLHRLNYILLALFFVIPSAITYRYVMQYHQNDRIQNDIILNDLKAAVHTDTVYCDLRLKNSPNLFLYKYKMPGRVFFLSKVKNDNPGFYLALDDYKSFYNTKSIFLALEYDGEECLWFNGKTTKSISGLMPSFCSLNLMDSLVTGHGMKGFYEERWINATAKANVQLKRNERLKEITITYFCSRREGQEMILQIAGKNIFKEHIKAGAGSLKIELDQVKFTPNVEFRFFSDLTKDHKSDLIGIRIDSMIFKCHKRKSGIKLEAERGYIRVAKNFRLGGWNPEAGDSLSVPLHFFNISENSKFVRAVWRDFAFKRIAKIEEEAELSPAKKDRLFYTINAPEKPGKYFLRFETSGKDKTKQLSENKSREYLFEVSN